MDNFDYLGKISKLPNEEKVPHLLKMSSYELRTYILGWEKTFDSSDLDLPDDAKAAVVPHGYTAVECLTFSKRDLESITIPSTVFFINYQAIKECHKLKNVTLFEGLLVIEEGCFFDCVELEEISLPDSVIYCGNGLFSGCEKLERIHLPKNISKLYNGAFRSCISLKSIELPINLTSIGAHCFWMCKSLQTITIKSNMRTLGEAAFYGCESLETVAIEDGLVDIESAVFCDCRNLKTLRLPSTLKTIGDSAFYDCSSLQIVRLPKSLTQLGKQVFEYCSGLTEITLSPAMTQIPKRCFVFCRELTNIVIPQSVVSIDDQAFVCCSKLKRIVLEDTITYIGEGVFNGCESLIIDCKKGSYAYQYAVENGITNTHDLHAKQAQEEQDAALHIEAQSARNVIDDIERAKKAPYIYVDFATANWSSAEIRQYLNDMISNKKPLCHALAISDTSKTTSISADVDLPGLYDYLGHEVNVEFTDLVAAKMVDIVMTSETNGDSSRNLPFFEIVFDGVQSYDYAAVVLLVSVIRNRLIIHCYTLYLPPYSIEVDAQKRIVINAIAMNERSNPGLNDIILGLTSFVFEAIESYLNRENTVLKY